MFIAGHLNEDVLERYAMRHLSEEDAETVEDHLSLCSHCQARLDENHAFIATLRLADKMSPARNSGWLRLPAWLQAGWRVPVWTGVAAGAAALILAVSLDRRPDELGKLALVNIEGTRGASTVAHGEGPFEFKVFMPAAARSYHVQLLDGSGDKRWEGDVAGDNGNLHVIVKRRIAAGQYYLHVTEAETGSQHDYGVRVEK